MSDERSGLRASDGDRERLIDELREHMAAGRLTVDELEHRTQAAYAAKTTSELEALRRDLPATARQLALDRASRRSRLTRRAMHEAGGSVALFVAATAVWAASGAQSDFWPVWILIIVALSVVRNGWALYGPGADLDEAEARLDARRAARIAREHEHGRDRRDRRRLGG